MANFKYSVGKCGCSCKSGCGSVPCVSAKWYRAIDYSPDDREDVTYLFIPNADYVNDELNIDLSVDPYVVVVSTDGGNNYSLPSIVKDDFIEQETDDEEDIQEIHKETIVQKMSKHTVSYESVKGFSNNRTFKVFGETVVKYDALALPLSKSEIEDHIDNIANREKNGIIRCPTGYMQLLTNRCYQRLGVPEIISIQNVSTDAIDQDSDVVDFLENYESGDLGFTIDFSFKNHFLDFNLDYDDTVGIVFASLMVPKFSSIGIFFFLMTDLNEEINPVQTLDLFCKRSGTNYYAYQNVPEIISGINPFTSTLSIDNVINVPNVSEVEFLSENPGGYVNLLNTEPPDYCLNVYCNYSNNYEREYFDVSPNVTLYNNGFLYDYNEDTGSCYITFQHSNNFVGVENRTYHSLNQIPASGKFLDGIYNVPENVLEFVSNNYGDYYPVFVKGNDVLVRLMRGTNYETAVYYRFDRIFVYLFDKFSIKNAINSMLESSCNKENCSWEISSHGIDLGEMARFEIDATVSCITNVYVRNLASSIQSTMNNCVNE